MNVLFFTSNSKFPIKQDGKIFNPIEVYGGYIFADTPEKRALLDTKGISYESIPDEEVLRWTYIYDEETGDLLEKKIPLGTDKSKYYNSADGETLFEKTLRLLNPLNWFS